MPNLVATRQSRSGLSTLGWLLLTAAVAAFVGTAVVVVQSVVRDVGIDAGSFSARFRAARIAADGVTREWRSHHPMDQVEWMHTGRHERLEQEVDQGGWLDRR